MAKHSVSVKKVAAVAPPPAATVEQRHRMIAEAAYYIAERRGFSAGNPEDDWYEAEIQIDRALGASPSRH